MHNQHTTPALYCWFREGSLPRECRIPCSPGRALSLPDPTAGGSIWWSNVWAGAGWAACLHCTHLLEIGFATEPRLQHSEIIPWAVMFGRQNRGREGVSNLPAWAGLPEVALSHISLLDSAQGFLQTAQGLFRRCFSLQNNVMGPSSVHMTWPFIIGEPNVERIVLLCCLFSCLLQRSFFHPFHMCSPGFLPQRGCCVWG